MAKKETDTTFLLRIDKDLKKQLEAKSKRLDRSLNWYINNIVKFHLNEK